MRTLRIRYYPIVSLGSPAGLGLQFIRCSVSIFSALSNTFHSIFLLLSSARYGLHLRIGETRFSSYHERGTQKKILSPMRNFFSFSHARYKTKTSFPIYLPSSKLTNSLISVYISLDCFLLHLRPSKDYVSFVCIVSILRTPTIAFYFIVSLVCSAC